MCVDYPGDHLSEDVVNPEGSMGHDGGGGPTAGRVVVRRSTFTTCWLLRQTGRSSSTFCARREKRAAARDIGVEFPVFGPQNNFLQH